MIDPIKPAVYKLKYDKDRGYYLDYYKNVFEVPGKNYGNIDKTVNIFWERYINSRTSMGVMLTGGAGSGKTRMAELLSNIAIMNNMAVVMVTEIPIKIELIPLIDSLYNMVVMFDEFSKNFDSKMQNKMLTMFSSVGANKKLFILTENNRNTISPYIRTRPGRVRYALDFSRIKSDVIEEYCRDYNVSDKFKEDIYSLHSKAPKFTFDHLQALVSEHLALPDYSLDDLLELLNLDDLLVPAVWVPVECIDLTTNEAWDIINKDPVPKDIIFGVGKKWLDIKKVNKENNENNINSPGYMNTKTLVIAGMNLEEVTEEEDIIFKVDEFKVTYSKRN